MQLIRLINIRSASANQSLQPTQYPSLCSGHWAAELGRLAVMKARLASAVVFLPLLAACDPAHMVRLEATPNHPASPVPIVIVGVAQQLQMQQSEGVKSPAVPDSFNYFRVYEPSKAVTLSVEPTENQTKWHIEIFEMPAFHQSWFSKEVQQSVENALQQNGYIVVPAK